MTSSKKSQVQKKLKNWLSNAEKIVIAGIGNPLRMDDFIGLKIVQNLQGKVSEKVYLIECETVPESFTQQIIDFNPTHILIIDAAILGKKPGDLGFIEPKNLAIFPAISTHSLPLRIFCDLLAKSTKAKIALLSIEPEHTDFGENLTPIVEISAKKIVDLLIKILP